MSSNRHPIFQSDTLTLLLTALFLVYTVPNPVTAFLILCALAYLIIDAIALALNHKTHTERLVQSLHLTIIFVAISLFVIAPTILFMVERARATPESFAQDSLLQIEAAARFILAGKNPYVEDYLETPMADWEFSWAGLETNPALQHFVYTPLAFLAAVPGEGIIRPLTHWYDHRLVLLVCYLINLALIKKLAGSRREANALLIAIGLNPLLITAYTCGNLDAMVLTGWLCTYLSASRRRWKLAFLSLALTITIKQIAVVAAPFLFLYWLTTTRPHTRKAILAPIAAFAGPLILLIGPFFLWHPRAFIEDTVLFIMGGIPDSWPISGMSLQALLPSSSSVVATLSITRWLLLTSVLVFSCYLSWRRHSLRVTLAFQTIFFAIAIFFGRFVNAQYVGYLLVQLALSLWIQEPAGHTFPGVEPPVPSPQR
jgi:uncharacterized membrane protein